MIIKFTCPCGNHSPSRAVTYDGSLGYEAMVCLECGRYSDQVGMHEPDEWSFEYIKHKEAL